tara:strand:- start:697 stop:1287 length:591 start_codon:yes stop_codon:yes gene_type:complete
LAVTDSPILSFWIWQDIEKDWDYLYLSVSQDNGITWSTLETQHMSQNPASGASLSKGYTGTSNEWENRSVDLSEYAGANILVRFDYITDQSVNENGVCIDNVSLSGVGIIEDAEGSSAWTSSGFIRTNNVLNQNFAVHIIELGEGQEVTRLEIDDKGGASFDIPSSKEDSAIIAVVSPITRKTTVPGEYRLDLTAR